MSNQIDMNPDQEQLLLLADQMFEWARLLVEDSTQASVMGIVAGLEDVARDVRRHVNAAIEKNRENYVC